ncbi:MAG: hypothetical protein ACREMY_18725 [bacterium]
MTRRSGSAAGGQSGERTVQLIKLPDAAYWSIILWSQKRSATGKKVNLGDIYDEALTWFLDREAKGGYEAYRAVPNRDATKRCLWVDSRLLERAESYAERDGVPRNRVLFTALVLFLKAFAPVATSDDITRLKKMKSAGGVRGRPLSVNS